MNNLRRWSCGVAPLAALFLAGCGADLSGPVPTQSELTTQIQGMVASYAALAQKGDPAAASMADALVETLEAREAENTGTFTDVLAPARELQSLHKQHVQPYALKPKVDELVQRAQALPSA
jgi:hypothetical protein